MEDDFPEFPPEIQTTWEPITPELAEKYLEMNTHNRNPRVRHVETMTKDLNTNRFDITHNGIAFDVNGVMLDGQQRCMAIIASGKGQWMLVTTGLPSSAQHRMDIGAKRNMADFMEGSYGTTRAAAHRQVYGIRKVGPEVEPRALWDFLRHVSTPELIEETPETEAQLSEYLAPFSRKACTNLPAISPGPMLAAMIVVFGENTEDAENFLKGIIELTDLQQGDPRLALVKFRGIAGKRIQASAQTTICIRIAQHWAMEKKFSVIRGIYTPVTLGKVEESS